MRNFFILMATTVLVQGVELTKNQDIGNDWLDSGLGLAQTRTLGKGKVGGNRRPTTTTTRPKPNTVHTNTTVKPNRPTTTTVQPTRPTTRPTRNDPNTTTTNRPTRPTRNDPNTTTTTNRPTRPTRNDPKTTTVDRPTRPNRGLEPIVVPNRPQKPALPRVPSDLENTQRGGRGLNMPDVRNTRTNTQPDRTNTTPAQRERTNTIATNARSDRVDTITSVRSRSVEDLPESRASRSRSRSNSPAPKPAVKEETWGTADKLVVGATIMQLPAMVAQTTMEAINAQEQADLSRQQHTDNYNLAVKQNDQVEADRLKQEMLDDEQRAKDAKAAEIAAIWRAQQKVQDDWADAVARGDGLEQELLDCFQAQDDLAALCADLSNGVPVGCEDPWGDQQKLVKQETEIYAAYDALDIEMDELLQVQEDLAQMEEDFCQDPGEFATDCLAVL